MEKQIGIVLVLLCLAVFSQVAGHEFVNYDDTAYVSGNPFMEAGLTPAGIAWAFKAGLSDESSIKEAWMPLTKLSHMLDIQLFGMNAGAHHLVNLLFHILNVLLLYFLLTRLTGDVLKSALVAAFFAVHPIQSEVVAWVTARKDLLCTFFSLGALWLYARSKPMLWVAASFALALLAKPSAVILPVLMALMDYWPLRRFRFQSLIAQWPLWLLAGVVSGITWIAQAGTVLDYTASTPVYFRVPAQAAFYLSKTLLPWGLTIYGRVPDYPMAVWKIFSACLCIGGISYWAWKGRHRYPALMTGWFWWLIGLLPVLALEVPADRYLYFPGIGLFLAVIWTLPERKPVWITAVILPFFLAPLAYAQAGYWKNSETLFTRAVALNPQNYTAHANLAAALFEKEDVRSAETHLRESLRLDPHDADTLTSLGVILESEGRLEEAVSLHEKAIQLARAPAAARTNLANVLTKQGKEAAAIEEYRKALEADPYYAPAAFNQATLLEKQGKIDEAMGRYREALRLRPNYLKARNNLGLLLDAQGRREEAIGHYEKILRVDPNHLEARTNLAVALARLGRRREALDHFKKAVASHPESAEARKNLERASSIAGS